jgi:hypothetical protein
MKPTLTREQKARFLRALETAPEFKEARAWATRTLAWLIDPDHNTSPIPRVSVARLKEWKARNGYGTSQYEQTQQSSMGLEYYDAPLLNTTFPGGMETMAQGNVEYGAPTTTPDAPEMLLGLPMVARATFHIRTIANERKNDPMPREGDMVGRIAWQRREDDRKVRQRRWEVYL